MRYLRSQISLFSCLGGTHQSEVLHSDVSCELIKERGPRATFTCPDTLHEMRQRCVLCHQWVARVGSMRPRYNYSHPEVVKTYMGRCRQFMHEHAQRLLTCSYCGSTVGRMSQARAHAKGCPVLFQLAILFSFTRTVKLVMAKDTAAQMEEVFGDVTNDLSGAPMHLENLTFVKRKDPATLVPDGMEHLKGQRRTHRNKGDSAAWSKDHLSLSEECDAEKIIQTICRALVQHEDTLRVLRQDSGFVFFVSPSQ